MTQSAISHQVKTLENYLEQPLFIRVNRKVVLSDAGIDLLGTTEECFDVLEQGLKRLEQFKKPNQFIIHTNSAFASNWLMSRLSEYRRQHGDDDIWLYTTDDKPDLDLAEVHLAIFYGTGHWPGLAKTRILDDILVPLCAPNHPLLKQDKLQARHLSDHCLLHGELRENWHSWFTSAGIDDVNPTSGPNFSNPALMLQAAEQGQGIALGSLVLAAESVIAGRLTSPVYHGITTKNNYYLVSRPGGLESPLLAPFSSWLVEQARCFTQGDYRNLQSRYDID